MKNNKNMQKIYKRRRIAVLVILAIILLCLIISAISKNRVQKIAQGENTLLIGSSLNIDISKITSKTEVNPPVVGAGMIPIKWNATVGMWEITTQDNWYDYSKGIFANVMLSDGYYQSELRYDMTNKELAKVGTQIQPEKLGTIFTWIPRFAYSNENDDILFLQKNSILEYDWTTESCFNLLGYGANSLDLALTGIWIGQAEFTNETQLTNKNAEMNKEENEQGLIASAKVLSIENSEKKAVQKLMAKYQNINNTMVQNADTMQYRQVIKIVNTNSRVPIVGKHTVNGNGIKVDAKYAENTINFVADKNGNKLTAQTSPIDEEETQYTFYIVDNIGNIRKYKMSYGSGKPDITKFNKNTTYYVVYDYTTGQEDSSIPIGEKVPADWYNYEEQHWANIVVRDNGQENYYVWIPRYMYKIGDATEQRIDAKFVDLENVWTDEDGNTTDLDGTEYQLPEAFTWLDDNGETVQLTGFWIGKYKLRAEEANKPNIYGLGGSIGVDGVVNKSDSYTYEMYLIQDGKRIVKDPDTKKYIEGTEPIDLKSKADANGNYKFTGLDAGKYAVNVILKDTKGNIVKAIAKEVEVQEKVEANKPDLSKYDKNLTYFVTYSADGKETSNIPIGEDETNQPKDWYDYDEDIKATIVVRDLGTETYYEWIPRYQCKIDNENQIMYIETSKTMPDTGYKIPNEFTKPGQETGYWKEKQTYTNRLLATVTADEDTIRVSNVITQTKNLTYEVTLIKDGQRQGEPKQLNTEEKFEDLESTTTYAIHVIAKDGNNNFVAGYAKQISTIKIIVDVENFNKNTTYYVVYNYETGQEDSTIPIGEEAPEGWYNYTEQHWANVVVRDNGQENYFVWVPRYKYKLDTLGNEKAIVQFIGTDETKPDDEYQIPEAFTWTDDAGNLVELPGFWIGKYKLREEEANKPDIYGLGGIIGVDGVVNKNDSYSYEMYLIQNGQRVKKEPIDLKAEADANGNYKFTGLDAGVYAVNIIIKDNTGKFVRAISKEVVVLDKVQENPPDLTVYNSNITYYVQYTAISEQSNIPIGKSQPKDWYDYAEDEKATVVVRDCGVETYYEWIPRYQCKIDNENQIMYIETEKTTPDEGYKIPEEFTKPGQEKGYWKEKQKVENRLLATIATDENKIRVSNEISQTAGIFYNVYLIQDGIIQENVAGVANIEHVFNISKEGKYAILVEQENSQTGTVAGYAREVIVYSKLEVPDVTGYRVDTTYIVTYNDDGTENVTQKLQDVLVAGAQINSDNTLLSGQIDLNKINGTWYNYTEQLWANIVTQNDGYTNYFTWVPRYAYSLDTKNEKVNAILIPRTITQDNLGKEYTIPEAFTWVVDDDNKVELAGFWIGKYKLRAGP